VTQKYALRQMPQTDGVWDAEVQLEAATSILETMHAANAFST